MLRGMLGQKNTIRYSSIALSGDDKMLNMMRKKWDRFAKQIVLRTSWEIPLNLIYVDEIRIQFFFA